MNHILGTSTALIAAGSADFVAAAVASSTAVSVAASSETATKSDSNQAHDHCSPAWNSIPSSSLERLLYDEPDRQRWGLMK